MAHIFVVPDTNFFIDHPDFVTFLADSRCSMHLVLLWPVLRELDTLRRNRGHMNPQLRDKGQRADTALGLIKKLQRSTVDGLEFEVYRPGVTSSSHPDAEIVDHAVNFAAAHAADDVILFVTSDGGLPTILFAEEKKRRSLENTCLMTTDELQRQLTTYGKPSASIEHIGLRTVPRTVNGQRGVDMFIDYSVKDFRHGEVGVAFHVLPPTAAGWQIAEIARVRIPTVLYKEKERKLFIPFSKLGAEPKRRGSVDLLQLEPCIWNLEDKDALARDPRFCLQLAVGACYLTTHDSQNAATRTMSA